MKKALLFALLAALFMPWAANAQTTLTVCDGTDNSNKVPFDGYNADSQQHNQMIFPANDLTAMNGKEITQMVFYIDQNASNGSSTAPGRLGTWTVSLGETEATTLDGLDNTTSLTQVYQGYFDCSTGTLTLAFSNNYLYHGGNLLVDLNHAAASWNTWYFLGENQEGVTAITKGASYQFLPKTTFSYQTPPTCPAPTLNAAEYVTEDRATFTWTENGSATNWLLQYSTNEDFTYAITVNRQGIPILAISDFEPLTTYYVRVKADCGGGDQSLWSNVISFTTTAVAQFVDDGWSDDFEGTDFGWELINGTLTNAWAWGTATSNGGTHALYVSNNGGTTNAYTNNSAAMVYATKLLIFDGGKYEFTYDWNGNGESSYDYLRVALVPASVTLTAGTSTPSGFSYSDLPDGWIALDGGSKLNQVTAWQSKSVAISVPQGNYYLVLAWRNDTSDGTNPPAAVDNVSVTPLACPYDVTDLAVSDITTTGATLTWTADDAEQWQVAYGADSNFEGATEEIVSTASYNISGLQSSSIYYVKVRAYCGGEDFGAWSNVLSFATACDVIPALGYTENFDSYTAGNNVLPTCWSYLNTTTSSDYAVYPRVYANSSYATYANSAPNCLYFYSYGSSDPQPQYAILPEMTGLAGLQVTLMAKGYNATSILKIGTMSDPTDASTFTMIAEQTLTTSYPTYPFEYLIPADCSDSYLAIMMDAAPSGYNTRGIYVDDIVIREAPSCLKPTELAVTGVSTNTVTLGWTNGADDQTAWQICLNGDETNLIMANSNPFTVEDLTAATSYTAKVRAYCGEDSQSDWSSEVSFTTTCEAITDLPWNEDFDAYTGPNSSSAPNSYPNDELPMCWQFLNRSDYSSTYPQVFISSNSGYPVSGQCLFFKSSSSTPLYAVLPAFEEEISGLQLTFTYRNEGTSASNGTLIVGYMTNPADATTFTEVLTCEKTTTLTEKDVLFTNAPAGSYIAFMYQGGSSNNFYMSIDNVKVDVIPTCTKPTALECTATTTTTATFSWTAGADETAWQICLNGDETNLIEANSNPFTVEGLDASTNYTAKVRAYCSADDQSDWSTEVSFATACEAVTTFPWMVDFESFVNETVPTCWDNSTSTTTTVNSNPERVWGVYSYEENRMMRMYNYFIQEGTALINTPDLVLPADAEYDLTFDYSHRASCGAFTVKISTDGGTTFTDLQSYTTTNNDYNYNVPGTFTSAEPISLADYAGQTVILQFYAEANYDYGAIFVDNVRVGAPVSSYTLTIDGYEDDNNAGGYYLIASPVTMDLTDHEMTSGDFDLYSFNQAEDDEWRNYKAGAFTSLEPGKGYLYAHKVGGEFALAGTAYDGNGTIELVYDDNAVDFKGWNLVGNPWGVKAYPDHAFYTMAEGGAGIDVTPNVAGTEVAAMTGIFVVAEGENETVTFETEDSGKRIANLALNITNSSKLVDRAIVRFGEGRQLPKFQLNPSHTKVYIEQDNKDYAIVNAEEIGEMPVSFKAEKNGSYTISFSNENVEFGYLHLVDNMTGADIDLLETPSYSFDAKVTDYASRFKLVFATSNDSNDDHFAFYYNGNIVINNEGSAILNIVDVLGRTISSQTINGSENVSINAKAGVYTLQLIQGEKVMTQKIVVE